MLLLDGESLTLEAAAAIAAGSESAGLGPDARRRMEASRAAVERLLETDKAVYGVNTGVGQLADVRIAHHQLRQLQINILRSHAIGAGPPLDDAEVRAMMLIRANVLAKGLSGIRPGVAEMLCEMLNRGVHPVVPSRGSVGASGDLAPLAHLALVLIGEGEARFEGERLGGQEALERAGLTPLTLEAKEGISLVNGTQAMLAVGCLNLLDAETLADTADVVCALSLDALRGTPVAFDPRIHQARPHPGQVTSARNQTALLEGSEIRASHIACRRVQDAYSLRCAPQVHGAVRDILSGARRTFSIELNSGTDNPLVFGDEVLSGGNFHGEPIAFWLDALATAMATLAGISERRIDRLVNPELNEGLPPFLAREAGLESGLMMAQVTAAALVAENRVLATPASVQSITTSGNKEDFVSMGMTAALKLKQAVENARTVLALEALCAAQALDFLLPLKPGPRAERAYRSIRTAVAPLSGDRELSADVERLARLIRRGELRAALP
ncbi:MAG TPA: histidine ammonia-lyase [Bryobacterales bacterium]|nr:histidine ammonia-lyase [Bryobacterales bacterium]